MPLVDSWSCLCAAVMSTRNAGQGVTDGVTEGVTEGETTTNERWSCNVTLLYVLIVLGILARQWVGEVGGSWAVSPSVDSGPSVRVCDDCRDTNWERWADGRDGGAQRERDRNEM